MSEDLFKQAESELNQEKLFKNIQKIIPYAAALIVFIILASIISVWYTSRLEKANKLASDRLYRTIVLLMNEQDKVAIESLNEIRQTGSSSVSGLATIIQAQLNFKHNKEKEAISMLEEAAKNSNIVTSGYAKITWLSYFISQPFESIDKAKFESYLSSFKNETDLFYGTGNIIKSLWLISNNKNKEASELLNNLIASQYTTYFIKSSAEAILANLN